MINFIQVIGWFSVREELLMFSLKKKKKGVQQCFVGIEDGIIWWREAGEMACTKAYGFDFFFF